MRIAVIGAGPAGLTAAFELAKGGAAVDVYEASSRVGGLAQSIDLWGQRVDLGPHRFFSTDARVNRFWLDIVGTDYHLISRLTRIYFNGKFFDYPLRPANVFSQLGIAETTLNLLSYARQSLALNRESDLPSFEAWVTRRFGKRLYETFFKTYSEKLWGIPCSELSEDFAVQRIRKLTLSDAVGSALFPSKRQEHRTLADCFAYPTQGAGIVYERIAERLIAAGGQVLLNRPIRQVRIADGRVTGIITADGREHTYDHVISTMPLTLLVQGLNNVPQSVTDAVEQLKFRNTVLIYLEVPDPQLFRDQWLYIHDARVRVGRVTNFSNWQMAASSSSILCCEYWCNDTDPTWGASDEQLADQAVAELKLVGLLPTSVQNSHVIRIPRSYPVYRIGYRQHVDVVSNFLGKIHGLSVIGRYGSFKYNNQDHSILMGLLASENILQSTRHNLWELNSDFESYQEDSYISETGLIVGKSLEMMEASC